MISAIVAMAHGNVIGRNNELPWHLPDDLKRFRKLTKGHAVVMGRKTADSIIARNGKPLPGRENIVVTRDPLYQPKDFIIVNSIQDAIQLVYEKDAFVIGGQQIYTQAMPYVNRLYITDIDIDVPNGDAFFPEIDPAQWREIERESHHKDGRKSFDYTFATYDRIT